MGTVKKSVDEIWKELNKRPTPRAPSTPSPASLGGVVPGVTSVTRTLPSSTDKAGTSKPSAGGVEDVPMSTSAVRRPAGAPVYDLDKAGVTPAELQAFLSGGVQRLINCLSDPDRATRREAVQKLQARLLNGDSATGTPAASPQLLQAIACGPLLYPLVGLLGDPFERCRSIALQLLTTAVQTIADVAPLVPAVVPELAHRMGTLPVAEPGEEVRLQLVQLVAALLQRAAGPQLTACAGDLSLVLCRGLEDTFHEIKKAACGALVALAAAVPAAALEPHSERLLQALIANLGHQHSRVRSSCIAAMDALLPRGVAPAGLIGTLVAPGLRPIAYDRSPAVRDALFLALAHWLGAGGAVGLPAGASAAATASPGLAASYAPALLPVLLVGVTDVQASTSQQALSLVEAVGDVWDRHQRGDDTPAAAAGSGAAAVASSMSPSPSGQGSDEAMQDSGTPATAVEGTAPAAAGDEDGSTTAAATATLPPPYVGRPGVGCRRMVRALLPQLLPPLIKELQEWTVNLRASAARSLHTVLVLAEDAATPHLPALLPALCNAIGDEDTEVAGCILRSVHQLGTHVAVRQLLPLLLDHLTAPRLTPGQRANALVVLSGLLHAAARAGQALPDDMVVLLASALTSDELRSTDHGAVRAQLLAATHNLLRGAGSRLAGVAFPMYLLVLHLYGHEKDVAKQQAIATVMSELAGHCGAASFEALAGSHASALLAAVGADAPAWAVDSSNYLVFRAFLLTAGAATLARVFPDVVLLLRPALEDPDREPNLRLSMLTLLDALLEDPVRGPSVGGLHAALVLRDLLIPPLTWRAGKVAAAVRFSACTALSTLLAKRLAPPDVLASAVASGVLLPLIHQCLDEDWYTDVRSSSCFVMEQLLRAVGHAMTAENRRLVYPELLKRLDDSSNAVRCAACKALVAFSDTLTAEYCDTNSGYLAAGVLIHMDDADPVVQEAACCALEALAVVKPAAVRAEVVKVHDRFRSKHYCDRVLAACG